MKIKQPIATPALTGLIYSPIKQQVGVVVDGVAYFPDGSCELGLGQTLALGTALDFMLRVINAAERHAVADGGLIPVEQYAKAHNLPIDELTTWAATPLGYVCGCRRIRLGFVQAMYVPASLQAEMVAAQEWMEANTAFEEQIIEELTRQRIYVDADVIARNLGKDKAVVIKQLDRMCLKKTVETRDQKYRVSKSYIKYRSKE